MALSEPYSTALLDRFNTPRFSGSLDAAQVGVISAQVGTPAQGAVVRLQLQLGDNRQVALARFQAYGDPVTIAVADWLCEHLQGQPLATARQLDHRQAIDDLQIPALKIRNAVLAETALRKLLSELNNSRCPASV